MKVVNFNNSNANLQRNDQVAQNKYQDEAKATKIGNVLRMGSIGTTKMLPMKYIAVLFFITISTQGFSQISPVESFLDGKAVVLVSASPAARPLMSWELLAEEVHEALVEAGGDPVAYYELEDLILTEGTQAGYAASFSQRLIKNIIVITRKENGEFVIHIMPFTQDQSIVRPGSSWSATADSLEEFKEQIAAIGNNRQTQNLLVIEVPEFIEGGAAATTLEKGTELFLARNPLNLDVFRLGVRLAGAAGESGYLTTFRYDLLGKSPEQILAEQKSEREGLQGIFDTYYPHEVVFLTEPQSEAELIKNRVQFILMRMEGREGDLMERMGVDIPESTDRERIVIKYYIKFLVRNELYIGPDWDADPNWSTALINFLENIE